MAGAYNALERMFGSRHMTAHNLEWPEPWMVRIPGAGHERLDGRVARRTGDRLFYGHTLDEAAAKALLDVMDKGGQHSRN